MAEDPQHHSSHPPHTQRQNQQVPYPNASEPENIPSWHGSSHSSLNDAPTTPPAHHLSDPSTQRIVLGSDPGELIASLPALMGFVPENSIILVGVQDTEADGADPTGASKEPRGLSLGPALRGDASMLQIHDLAVAFHSFVDQLPRLGAVVVYLGSSDPARRSGSAQDQQNDGKPTMTFEDELVVTAVLSALEERRIPVYTTIISEAAATGAQWTEYGTGRSGTVADVERNPVGVLLRSKSTKFFANREDIEHWIAPTEETACNDPVMSKFHAGETCTSAIDLALAFNTVREGSGAKESTGGSELSEEHRAVLGALCLEDEEHVLVVMLGMGSGAALLREELARLVRNTSGVIRRRCLLILGIVLGLNDEGTLSAIMLRRCIVELAAASGNGSEYESGFSDSIDNSTHFIVEAVLAKFLSGEHRALARAITQAAAEIIRAAQSCIGQEESTPCARALDTLDWEYIRMLCGIEPENWR